MEKINLYEIFKEKLIPQNNLENLWDLIENDKIIYDQYYQRNYVWNSEKATNFIESILLGTEIPPMVFFEQTSRHVEIIDGRQRYETIKRFLNNEFKLKRSGLNVLKIFKDRYFKDLPIKVQNIFRETDLRVFRYRIDSEIVNDIETLDSIKKELFKRYNVGLTPLKQYEIEKAIFIKNDLNQLVKKNLKKDLKLLNVFHSTFLKEKELDKDFSVKTIELLMKKFRFLVSLQDIPINYYSWCPSKSELIHSIFRYISDSANPEQIYSNFKETVYEVSEFIQHFKNSGIETNYLISEIFYWLISIIKTENLDITILKSHYQEIAEALKENPQVYIDEQSHHYKSIIERYTFAVNIAQKYYNLDFEKYVTTSDYSKVKIKQARDIKTKKQVDKILDKIRLTKPDTKSSTIKTYMTKIQGSHFVLRPSYQREESMNIPKASGLIESILLDFKIAPIFIYEKEDGTREVIDGQQRLLTILAFMGVPYSNKQKKKIYSEKNTFKLTGLKYLKEFNGCTYLDLPEEMKERFLKFQLNIITVQEKTYPRFDPVDLFIRLNNRPYPIKEHSFEMWNASCSVRVTEEIKKVAKENSLWLYLRSAKKNLHLQNEELFATLMYLEHTRRNSNSIIPGNSSNEFRFYSKQTRLSCLLRDRKMVTQYMERMSGNEYGYDISGEVENINQFIDKLKLLLECGDSSLKDRLNNLIFLSQKTRTLHNIYLLWYLLSPIDKDVILHDREGLYNTIQEIFTQYKQEHLPENRNEAFIEFQETISKFWTKYIEK